MPEPGSHSDELSRFVAPGAETVTTRFVLDLAMKQRVRLEAILRDLRRVSGLYLLGAGMSAGLAPFASAFMTAPAIDYLRNSSSFPAQRTAKNLRTRRVRAFAASLSVADIHPERGYRPSMMDD